MNYSPAAHEEARRLLTDCLKAYRDLSRLPAQTDRQTFLNELRHARLIAASLRFQLDRIDAPARYQLGGIVQQKTPTPQTQGGPHD